MIDVIQPSAEQPVRGTIIVDSSALLNLCKEVPVEFRVNGATPENYLRGLLGFLAQHGYCVIITGMVSYEAAGILSNGQSVEVNFDQHKYKRRKTCEAFIRDAVLERDDQRKEYRGAKIITRSGPEQVDRFLDQLTAAALTKPEHGKKREGWRPGTDLRRAAIIAVIRMFNPHGFGNISIQSLLLKLKEEDKLNDVAILTDNAELLHEIKKTLPDITTLKSQTLAHDIGSSKVASFAGFSPNVTPEDLETNVRGYHITREPSEIAFLRRHQSSSFYKSLQQLAADLKQQSATQPAPESDNTSRSTGMARFTAKYGARKLTTTDLTTGPKR